MIGVRSALPALLLPYDEQLVLLFLQYGTTIVLFSFPQQLVSATRCRVDWYGIKAGVVALSERLRLIVVERPQKSQTINEIMRRRNFLLILQNCARGGTRPNLFAWHLKYTTLSFGLL